MKKIIITFLAVLLCLTVTGCGNKSANPEDDSQLDLSSYVKAIGWPTSPESEEDYSITIQIDDAFHWNDASEEDQLSLAKYSIEEFYKNPGPEDWDQIYSIDGYSIESEESVEYDLLFHWSPLNGELELWKDGELESSQVYTREDE